MTKISGDFLTMPLVDLSAWKDSDQQAQAALAGHVREICHHAGFMLVTDHGVDWRLVEDVFALSERLFALPEAQKRLIHKRHSRHYRGWEPVGGEYTNNRPDIREQVDLWSEHPAQPDHFDRIFGSERMSPTKLISYPDLTG